MKKTSFAILTLTAAASITFAADSAAPKKAAASKVIKATVPVANFNFLPAVVAEVNGKKLTKTEVIKRLSSGPGGKIPQGVTQEILVGATKQMATRFVEFTALLDAAIKAGFKPSAELVVKEFKKYLKTAPPFQMEQLKKSLAQQGLTLESYIEKSKNQKMFQDQMAINAFLGKEKKAIVAKCKVSEKDAKAYYDANLKRYQLPADSKDSMRASHILIMAKEKDDAKTKAAAKAKAEKLLKLLQKDTSLFGELAEKESQCPSGKNKGSLGAFTKGRMVPEFEQAVVNLKTGEISAVVQTKFGYHIIRRDALKKAETKTFAEVKDDIQKGLVRGKTEKAFMDFIKKITDAAKGKVYIK